MRRKLLLLFLILSAPLLVVYGVLVAPGKLNQVDIQVVEGRGDWKSQISKYVVTMVQPGQLVTPSFADELERRINSLPWVREAEVEVKGGRLTIKVKEASPSFYLIFDKNVYLIGENDFVLEIGKKRFSLPTYYYCGESTPFSVEEGFLKLKFPVKMEVELLKSRLRELNLGGESPQAVLSETPVILAYRGKGVIVYLSPEKKSWEQFEEFKRRAKALNPGIYDFRYYDILVRGRI